MHRNRWANELGSDSYYPRFEYAITWRLGMREVLAMAQYGNR